MAKTKSKATIDATLVLQIVVVLFLITLGILAIMQYNSRLSELGRAFNRLIGRPDNPVNLITGIAELVAGIILGLALFVPIRARTIWIASLVIAILWIVKIFWVYLFNNAFAPDFIVWSNGLSTDLIILVGLWMVGRRYA